jgi:ubiquinone/menaquinone biosynthesis C-methylase UbiE
MPGLTFTDMRIYAIDRFSAPLKWNATMRLSSQNKAKEIEFFDATNDEYDVFLPASKARIIAAFRRLTGLPAGAKVADIGCGSGTFSALLGDAGYEVTGLDISPALIATARAKHPNVSFVEGDAENLPFDSGSFDGVLLSGLVHHFPDPQRCIGETFRVLRPGGKIVAFDPNRLNPFMYFYRDPSSPFYSSTGVTENERPVLPRETLRHFRVAGFSASVEYMSGMSYRYIASAKARILLPTYNAIDKMLFAPNFMKSMRPFVLTYGTK